jgi:hypothetical protein
MRVRRLGPGAHAALDYWSVVGLVAAPRVVGLTGRARRAAQAVAAATFAVTALTDTPRGLVPVIPYRTHGKPELGSAAGIAALPWAAGFAADRRARRFFLGTAVAVAALWVATDWRAGPGRGARMPATDGGRGANP